MTKESDKVQSIEKSERSESIPSDPPNPPKKIKLVSARISLDETTENELLFTALIEKAKSYNVTVKEITDRMKNAPNGIQTDKNKIDIKTKRFFDLIVKGEVFELEISTETLISKNSKLRIFCYKKSDGNGQSIIVVTIDNPILRPIKITAKGKKLMIENPPS